MTKFKTLRPMAFRPQIDQAIPNRVFYKLSFPVRWHSELQRLWSETSKNKGRSTQAQLISLPIAALNETLRAIVPDLIRVLHFPDRSGALSWLYSSQVIDTSDILSIVRAWAEVCLKDVPHSALHAVTSGFEADELIWHPAQLAAHWTTSTNGTATPQGDYFSVLPYFLAAELSQHPFEIGNEVFDLRRYPIAPMHNGAELMGWEPVWYQNGKGETGAFAPYINLTVQSIPFQADPVLYVHTGVRRFVAPSQTGLRHIKSAVIYTSASWIKGLDYTHSFQTANVKMSKSATEGWQLTWKDELITIIDKLRIGKPLPLAHELMGRSETYRFDAHTQLALVQNTQVGSHVVSAGASTVDRLTTMAFVTEHIAPGWVPVGEFTHSLATLKRSQKTPFAFEKLDSPESGLIDEEDSAKKPAPHYTINDVPARCERLVQTLGHTAHLSIRYQNPPTEKAILAELEQLLGTPYDPANQRFSTQHNFLLQVHSAKAGELAAALADTALREQTYQAAKSVRQQAIAASFPKRIDAVPGGVLFELADATVFNAPNTDPKQAIRHGLAAQGYLSQFISASTRRHELKNLPHRVRMALLDLLRQWGVTPHPIRVEAPTLPTLIHFMGLWTIRFQAKFTGPQIEFPVAVLVSTDSDKIWVKIPGQDDWVTYANAQLLLTNSYVTVPAEARRLNITNWLCETLRNLPQNTLLLTDAQNMRSVWKEQANPAIQKDYLTVAGRVNSPVTACNGLRMVRIRQDQQNEAPQAFSLLQKADITEYGRPQGVYTLSERVYLSAGGKPKTAPYSAKGTKYAPFNTSRSSRTDGPAYGVWNPRVCELTVAALQPDEDPALWAAVVHRLRSLSLQFDDMTTLPLPLHLADKLEEYVRI